MEYVGMFNFVNNSEFAMPIYDDRLAELFTTFGTVCISSLSRH